MCKRYYQVRMMTLREDYTVQDGWTVLKPEDPMRSAQVRIMPF